MSQRRAFSTIDALVILVLLLTAMGLILAFLPRQREHGLRVQCMNNLKQLGDGLWTYHKAHDFLPPARIADGYATWAVLLAPHVSRQPLLAGWDAQKPFVDQDETVRRKPLAVYFCPARNRTISVGVDGALGDYAAVAGNGDPRHPWDGPEANGPFVLGEVLQRQDDLILTWRGRVTFTSLQRGLSYTLLIGEKHVALDRFGEVAGGDGSLYDGRFPANSARVAGPGHGLASSASDLLKNNFGSSHPGLCQFLSADGGVRSFNVTMDPDVLGRLTTRVE